jgi:O-antigen ligase
VAPAAAQPAGPALPYVLLLAYVFAATSRVLDFTLPNLHLPLVLLGSSALLTFISGGIRPVFSTAAGKMMGLFVVWFMACIPFSQWKGGSFDVLTNELIRSLVVFAIVTVVVSTVARLQGLIAIIGAGTVVTMAIALAQNERIDGRLTMSAGQYSNPNDLAQILLLGMCCLPVLGTWLKNRVLKALCYLAIVPFLYTVFITGSRSALITAIVLAGVVFFYSPAPKKILLLLLFPILGGGLLSLSDTARLRLRTLLENNPVRAANYSEEVAIASANARILTLKQSLQLTLEHPLFGVGPGVFQSAAAGLRSAQSQRALWIETHNSYTQVSSETGVPGLILFCGAVLVSLRQLLRVRAQTGQNPRLAQLHDTTNFLLVGFLTYTLTSLFSSVAYNYIFWMLIGLCAASIPITSRELGLAQNTAASLSRPPQPAYPPAPARPATRVTLSGRIKARKPAAGVHPLLRG